MTYQSLTARTAAGPRGGRIRTGRPAEPLPAAPGAVPGSAPLLAAPAADDDGRPDAVLTLTASAGIAAPAVLAGGAAPPGWAAPPDGPAAAPAGVRPPGRRDRRAAAEERAVERARRLFGARYAEVRPHSGPSANRAVLSALLRPGDTVLGLGLDDDGRIADGSLAAVSGRHYRVVSCGPDDGGRIDFGRLAHLAAEHRPRVLIAGAGGGPRTVDFARLRTVADGVGAYLVADITRVAGLVAAGRQPNPVDVAHLTTTGTRGQLGGPRGGLILGGREHTTPGPDGRTPLHRLVARAVPPRPPGTPGPAAVAALDRALAAAGTPAFRAAALRTVRNARSLARELAALGRPPLTGGTDSHLVLVDVAEAGLSGLVAERALARCGILADRHRLPGDTGPAAGGLRLGTGVLSQRGMGPPETAECARLLHTVLAGVTPLSETAYRIDPALVAAVRAEVRRLCSRFPVTTGTADGVPASPIGVGA